MACFSDSLVVIRKCFGGDLDQFLIYLMFALGELSNQAQRRGAEHITTAGINALSVADITLIPRETARRKLRELAARIHLRWGADGLWYPAKDDMFQHIAVELGPLLETAARLRPGTGPIGSA